MEPITTGLFTRRTVIRSAATGAVLVGAAALGACAAGDDGEEGGQPTGGATGGAPQSDENPFGVEKGKALEVVIFDGGYGKDYGQAHVDLYNAKWGPDAAKMTATVKIASTLQPRFTSGNPPEVIDNSGADAMPTAQLVAQNQLADLGSLLDAPTVDDASVKVKDILIPGVVDAGSFEGTLRQLNYVFSMWGIWYSKPLFEKNNWEPAKTMDDFMALCEKIKSQGKMSPFIHTGVHTQYMTTIIAGQAVKHGGRDIMLKIDNLDPDAWTNDSVVAAAKAWEEVTKAGYIDPAAVGLDHTTSQAEWLNGKAAMIPCGSWLENEMKGKVPDGFDMVVQAVPSLTADDTMPFETLSAGAGEPFVVAEKSANKAGGLEYLRIMLGKDATSKFADLTGNLCAVKDAGASLKDPSTALQSVADAAAAAGDNMFEVRFMTWYADLKTAARDATRNLLTGKYTSEQYVSVMQDAVDKVAKDPKITKFKRT